MRRSQLVYDGLWRCLCPAFDQPALRKAVNSRIPSLLRPMRRPAALARPTTCAKITGARQYGLNALDTKESIADVAATQPPSQRQPVHSQGATWEERLLAPMAPDKEILGASTVDEIITALMTLRHSSGWSFHGQDINRHERIIQLVEHLLSNPGQAVSPLIYECMVDAMVDPEGSAEGVRKLLDDAATRDIQPTAAMCQSALDALTIHPDYVLRQEVLDIMAASWFTVGTPAKQSVVLGQLRDGQYELAYSRLTEMIEQGARIDVWVFDVFIMVFGRLGFLDEMMQLLYRRKSVRGSDEVIPSLLYYVLDVCSEAFFHSGTVFAWTALVRNSLLEPSDGMVENVLGTAARHGNAELASEALDLISSRTRVAPHHYEAVAEAFCRSEDMTGAIRVLCIMNKTGIRVVKNNTRVMYEMMKRRPELVDDAEAAIRKVHADEVVPVMIVDSVIEATSELRGSKSAMGLFNDIQLLCDESPTPGMIQTLLINSKGDAETARELAAIYRETMLEDKDPVRNYEVYRSLISTCADMGELDLAFRFAGQAVSLGYDRKRHLTWLGALTRAASEAEDGRIWELVDGLEKSRDGETVEMVRGVLRRMRMVRMTKGKMRAGSM